MRRSWPTGPLHFDNQSIFKERFHLDKADPNILHDEITVIDHALTRPWTVDKRYRCKPNPRPNWPESYYTENNAQIVIGSPATVLNVMSSGSDRRSGRNMAPIGVLRPKCGSLVA
jgi:hypothetical protein